MSDDGSTGWTQVYNSPTLSYTTCDNVAEVKTFTFSTQSNKKGLRFNILTSNNSWNHTALAELEVYNK